MPGSSKTGEAFLLAASALFLCLAIRSDSLLHVPMGLEKLPRVTLWVWERREDLHTVDPKQYAIAYLDQTLTIDLTVHRQPRRNPINFPSGAKRIPVVRIEASRYAMFDDAARKEAADAILLSAAEPGIVALQVDFDATLSQRQFYRALLADLRLRMPIRLPLSITALTSWCSWDTWIRDLPIDDAVPMFFRMEPDRRRAPSNLSDFRIREPLCQASAGVSTTEPWPSSLDHKRIYVFPDKGWGGESFAEIERRLR